MAGDTYEDWTGHVIVWGLQSLGLRIVEQLREAGERVVVVDDEDDPRLRHVVRGWGVPQLNGKAVPAETLAEAGAAGALAVICVERTDLRNLEISLVAREMRPDLRVVTHIRNAAVGRALAEDPGPGAVLDVAALSAPSVAEACLGGDMQELAIGGTRLVVGSARAAATGTLRELYGDAAAPLAVSSDAGVLVCPSRDHKVQDGDGVTLMGAQDELLARGVAVGGRAPSARPSWRGALMVRLRWIADEAGPGLRRALASMLLLVAASTVVLWHGYATPGMSPLDGLYFTIETIATVGFGDFSFADQPTWLRIYATCLMLLGVTNTAVLLAYLTDLLVSRRLERSSGRRRAARMSGHVVIAGLGTVGVAAVSALHAHGHEVAVIERDDDSAFLDQARALGVPVIFGDATVPATLAAAGISRAAAVAVLTSDDMVNIETALALRNVLGERWDRVPVVPRIFDRTLARTLADRFGFAHVRSTAELAAPWFVGAALGLDVLGTLTAEGRPLMAGRFTVTPGSALQGTTVRDLLPEQIRVLALDRRRPGPPSTGSCLKADEDDRLGSGDGAYVIGPHAELLGLLRRARPQAAPTAPTPGEDGS
ncbi:potassium channel family protein [Actinomadura rubrisoli]|uniref:Potassium transporter TrkA n=1 Tax=Actinomadura rubrisoli TaxID=2530368 RepID=A0A4R5BBN3_9ACTN|nr:potassium channel protein [Actinomadura rubrisoli]TDD82935.1 potassium transporter TrkA [Actinomadura rubrisoli]